MAEPLRLTYSVADQSFAQTKSLGILRLSLDLLGHLAARPDLVSLAVVANRTLTPTLRLPAHVTLETEDAAIAGRGRRLWWDQSGVYTAAQRLGRDWLLLPKGFASGLRRCPVRLATYVHDIMPDYYWEHHRSSVGRLENAYFRWALRCSIRHSQVVLTNSAFTASEVARMAEEAGLKPPPIRHVGIGFRAMTERSRGPRDAILVLASWLPHKRTDLAVEYLARWQAATGFAGKVHWVGRFPGSPPHGRFANWEFHPRVPDEVYEQLQRVSRAVVYFSEYEGFGMPPVEAALAGACPVYSDIPAAREVMAGAGCPFVNGDYSAFAAALSKALTLPAEQLRRWADDLLRRHNWEAVGARVVGAMAEVDAQRRAGNFGKKTADI